MFFLKPNFQAQPEQSLENNVVDIYFLEYSMSRFSRVIFDSQRCNESSAMYLPTSRQILPSASSPPYNFKICTYIFQATS